MLKMSRFIGLGASVGVITLWGLFSFFNPYGDLGAISGTYLVTALMVLVAITGIIAALTDNAVLMLGVFILSFVPVGFYTLGTPGIFRWIGIFNILFLLSSLPGLFRRRQAVKLLRFAHKTVVRSLPSKSKG